MVAIAQPTRPRSPAAIAAPAYEPTPGSAYRWLSTLIASEATRKNQPPPKLSMPFHTRLIIPEGSSTFQKRIHRLNPNERDNSSSSRGSETREW